MENGVDLGMPDGVLINGLGPYRYDDTLVPNGISYQIINVEPGKICHSRFFGNIRMLVTCRHFL